MKRLILIFIAFFFSSCSMISLPEVKINKEETLQPSSITFEEGDFMLKSNIRLHYYYYKKLGSTLLVHFHGGPGSNSSLFRLTIGEDLANLVDGSVLYIDEIGSGLSQKENLDPKVFTFENEISGLHEVIEKFSQNRQIIIMGHSFGGTLAVNYAKTYPQEVSAYILSAPFLNEKFCRNVYYRSHLPSALTKIEQQELEAVAIYKDKIQEKHGQGDMTFNWYKNEPLLTKDYLPFLKYIKVPTLVLSGEYDTNVPKKQIEAMKPYLDKAIFVYLPNAGHKAYLLQKSKYLQAIQDFLTDL